MTAVGNYRKVRTIRTHGTRPRKWSAKKCHVLEREESRSKPIWKYKNGNEEIDKAMDGKRVGSEYKRQPSTVMHMNILTEGTYTLLTYMSGNELHG